MNVNVIVTVTKLLYEIRNVHLGTNERWEGHCVSRRGRNLGQSAQRVEKTRLKQLFFDDANEMKKKKEDV